MNLSHAAAACRGDLIGLCDRQVHAACDSSWDRTYARFVPPVNLQGSLKQTTTKDQKQKVFSCRYVTRRVPLTNAVNSYIKPRPTVRVAMYILTNNTLFRYRSTSLPMAICLTCRIVLRHSLQFKLTCEVVSEVGQLPNQSLTSRNNCILWCCILVCLDSEFHACNEGVGDLVADKQDVVVLCQTCTQEVTDGMVLFIDCEDGSVW